MRKVFLGTELMHLRGDLGMRLRGKEVPEIETEAVRAEEYSEERVAISGAMGCLVGKECHNKLTFLILVCYYNVKICIMRN
jgi:hypothetical protein